jgi:hypothetical protein
MGKVDKDLHLLVGAIFTNQLALNFNEELKHTRFYKKPLKNTLIKTIRQLIIAEKNEFEDVLLRLEEEHTEEMSKRLLDFVNNIIKQDWQKLLTIAEVAEAFEEVPEVGELVHNILKKKREDENSKLSK